MPGRQGDTGDRGGRQVDPIDLVVKMVDRLNESIDRLERMVREDFASQAELENVKLAVQHLRDEVARLGAQMERRGTEQVDQNKLADSDRRIAKWLIRAAIPSGIAALAKFAWDAGVGAWLKSKGGP